MKVTNREVSDSRPALNDLGSKSMKASTAHYVSKAIIAVNRALEPYDLTQNNLIEKYEAKIVGGQIIFENEDDGDKFVEEMKPIRDEEVELQVEKISIKKLGNIQIAPGTFVMLDWLLED